MTQLVQLGKLTEYTECSNYYKYNKLNHSSTKSVSQIVIESCYRDAAVLEKRTDWKAIRGRIHEVLLQKEPSLTSKEHYRRAVQLMESCRNWYLQEYRPGTEECLLNIELQEEILPEFKIQGIISSLLLSSTGTITIIEFSNNLDVISNIEFRTKLYLLHKQNIKVNQALILDCTSFGIKYSKLNLENITIDFSKIEQVLKLNMLGIKNNIFFPSQTEKCNTCRYKAICSW